MIDQSVLPRSSVAGKPVLWLDAKSVINFHSGFQAKLLCDGLTFSMGSACVLSCTYCYVPAMSVRNAALSTAIKGQTGAVHSSVVARRKDALKILRDQLTHADGKPRFLADEDDRRVIYASPVVDVAPTKELADETIAACRIILDLTHWQIRLLSKSTYLPRIARALPAAARSRMIYGVSTGTLNDDLARVFELRTPLVRKRVSALHWLQDHGYRTFGMICPSLPQVDQEAYDRFAQEAHIAIRADRCEHVWAEPMNARGQAKQQTVDCLRSGGFASEAGLLDKMMTDAKAWEHEYSRPTFLAHAKLYPTGKLRYLQYVTPTTQGWWAQHAERGAILLGKHA